MNLLIHSFIHSFILWKFLTLINYIGGWLDGGCIYASERFTVFCRSETEKNVAGAEQRCPIRGRHTIFTGTANCDSHFRSSCSSPNVVDIVSTCSSRPGQAYTSFFIYTMCVLYSEYGMQRSP